MELQAENFTREELICGLMANTVLNYGIRVKELEWEDIKDSLELCLDDYEIQLTDYGKCMARAGHYVAFIKLQAIMHQQIFTINVEELAHDHNVPVDDLFEILQDDEMYQACNQFLASAIVRTLRDELTPELVWFRCQMNTPSEVLDKYYRDVSKEEVIEAFTIWRQYGSLSLYFEMRGSNRTLH